MKRPIGVTWNPDKGAYYVRAVLRIGKRTPDRATHVYPDYTEAQKAKNREEASEARRRAKRQAKLEAERIHAEFMDDLREEKQRAQPRRNPKMSDFVRNYYLPRLRSMTNRGGPNCGSTIRKKLDVIEEHILPYFGEKQVAKISHDDIRAFTTHQENATYTRAGEERNYARTTISTHLKVLKHILNAAADMGMIRKDKLPKITIREADKVPKHRSKRGGQATEQDAFTQAERQGIVQQALEHGPTQYAMTVLLMCLGPRISVAIALRWEDIRDGWIHFARQSYEGEIKDPKTGPRRVPLHPEVEAAFKCLPKKSAWVFPSTRDANKHVVAGTVRDWGKKYVAALGIEKGFGPHKCRHTCATYLLMSGIDAKTVADWLGHDVKTLMGTYAHLLAEDSHRKMHNLHFDCLGGDKPAVVDNEVESQEERVEAHDEEEAEPKPEPPKKKRKKSRWAAIAGKRKAPHSPPGKRQR